MGWYGEAFQSAVDKLKGGAPDLTPVKDACRVSYGHVASVAGTIGGTIGGVGTPCLSQVKNICRGTYDYGWWAVGQIDHAVRVAGLRRIEESLPDADSRREIGRVLAAVGKSTADIAISEAARCVPGGLPLYRVSKQGASEISRILREGPKDRGLPPRSSQADHVDDDGGTRLLDAPRPDLSKMTEPHTPEDVIRLFMTKGFKGGDFLDALIVPKVRGGFVKEP